MGLNLPSAKSACLPFAVFPNCMTKKELIHVASSNDHTRVADTCIK